jgi:hypothetical protein
LPHYRFAHPQAADVLLIIEVADSSLDYDRNTKLPLYARHGANPRSVPHAGAPSRSFRTPKSPPLSGQIPPPMLYRHPPDPWSPWPGSE